MVSRARRIPACLPAVKELDAFAREDVAGGLMSLHRNAAAPVKEEPSKRRACGNNEGVAPDARGLLLAYGRRALL